jgi:hypothetical protein
MAAVLSPFELNDQISRLVDPQEVDPATAVLPVAKFLCEDQCVGRYNLDACFE